MADLKHLSLRVELNVPAEQIVHHLQLHNSSLEKQVTEAFDEMLQEVNLKELIKNATNAAFVRVVENAFTKWDFKQKLEQQIQELIWKEINSLMEKKKEDIQKMLDGINSGLQS